MPIFKLQRLTGSLFRESANDHYPYPIDQLLEALKCYSIALLFFIALTPANAEEPRYFRRTEGASTVIVFVHGFLGNAISSWTNGRSYWPQMVAEDATFKNSDVYVYEYPTHAANFDFSIDELADDMRIRFIADGVSSHAHLIFIAHSMGALVTRSFLLKYRDIAARTDFLYFLSSPTTGAEVAALAALINRSPQLSKMKPLQSADYLADLQRSWLAAKFPFPTFCAYEKRPTFGILVVTQSSASSLCTRALDPIDADHISISKPAKRTSAQYEAFANAFREASLDHPRGGQLSFQYARLFGALEIPLLMTLFPAPAFEKSDLKDYVKPKGKGFADAVRIKLARFAQNLPFQDARPLLTDLWADVVGNDTAAMNIFWRASSAGRNERACFYMEPLVDEIALNEELVGPLLPKNWENSCATTQEIFDRRIGFTFLLIENESREMVEDISLFYRETYSENRVVDEYNDKWRAKKIRSTIVSIPNKGSALQNLFAKYSTAHAVEDAVKFRPLKEIKMSEMKPGEKRIVALNIYFSNERNLPAGYLYGIYEFEKAAYSTSNGRRTTNIRRPYLEKAARVAVPYGWFNQ